MSSLFTPIISPFSRLVDSFDYSTISGKIFVASLCATGFWLTRPPPVHARRVGTWPLSRMLPLRPNDPFSSIFADEQSQLFASIAAKHEKGRYDSHGRLRGCLKASGSYRRWEGKVKSKAVGFAGERHREVLVHNWINPLAHQHRKLKFKTREEYDEHEALGDAEDAILTPSPVKMVPNGHVQWDFMGQPAPMRYDDMIVPGMFNLVDFPLTPFPRNVPDIRLEDDEGDLVMTNASDGPPSTSMESFADSFALLTLEPSLADSIALLSLD